MSNIEITSTSSKGQVVIPQNIRQRMGIEPGTKFAAYGKKDTIILKKLKTPSIDEFEKIVDYGIKFAKQKGIKTEKDVLKLLK